MRYFGIRNFYGIVFRAGKKSNQAGLHAPVRSTWSRARYIQTWLSRHHRLAAFGVYLVLTLVITYPLIFNLENRLPGPFAEGDHYQNIWNLWWFRQALLHGQNPAYSDFLYGLLPGVQVYVMSYFNALAGFFLQTITSPLGTYNLLILLGFVLSGFTTYLLASEFVPSRLAAFAAGFFFSFSSYHFFRASGHLGLATLQWLPFCACRLFVFFQRPSRLNAIWAGAGMALVAWSDAYYGVYFVLPFVLVFLTGQLLVNFNWFRRGRHLRLSLLSLVVALLLLLPVGLAFLPGDPDLQTTNQATAANSTEDLSADLLGYFLPFSSPNTLGASQPVYYKQPFDVEKITYLGLVLFSLAVAAWFFPENRNRICGFWIVLALTGLLLSFGPKLYIAGQVIREVPFYNLLYGWSPLGYFRAPARLAVLPMLSCAVLAGFSLNSIFNLALSRLPSPFNNLGRQTARSLPFALLLLLLGFSLYQNILWEFPLKTVPVSPLPPIVSQMLADPEPGLVLNLPAFPPTSRVMRYQLAHGRPVVTGNPPRISNSMYNSVWNLPGSGPLLDPALINTPLANGSDIFPGTTDLKTGLQENNIRYVLLDGSLLGAVQAKWIRQYLIDRLGPPIFDSLDARDLTNPTDRVAAWQVETVIRAAVPTYQFKLTTGWISGLSIRDELPERRVVQDARLNLIVGTGVQPYLQFKATPFFKPLSLEIRINGQLVKVVTLPQSWQTQTVRVGPLNLNKGDNLMEFHVQEGCTVPREVDKASTDSRCVALGLQEFKLLTTGG